MYRIFNNAKTWWIIIVALLYGAAMASSFVKKEQVLRGAIVLGTDIKSAHYVPYF